MASQTRQLFGTDGIRGVAGEFPLTEESTYLIGRALGHDLIRSDPKASVIIGQDTRQSSGWIADRIALGLASTGCEVHSAGVITTPGVAYLARSRKHAAGVKQPRRRPTEATRSRNKKHITQGRRVGANNRFKESTRPATTIPMAYHRGDRSWMLALELDKAEFAEDLI